MLPSITNNLKLLVTYLPTWDTKFSKVVLEIVDATLKDFFYFYTSKGYVIRPSTSIDVPLANQCKRYLGLLIYILMYIEQMANI